MVDRYNFELKTEGVEPYRETHDVVDSTIIFTICMATWTITMGETPFSASLMSSISEIYMTFSNI